MRGSVGEGTRTAGPGFQSCHRTTARCFATSFRSMRSGAVGRKSLGTAPKRLVRDWFESRSEEVVFTASVGQSPSFADIVKMVHPKPNTAARAALYAYFIGREYDAGACA